MNRLRTLVSVAAITAFSFLAISALAQEDEAPQMTPEQQAEMAAWMALAQPGEHHEHLAPFVGKWKGTVQMWMGPDAPEMVQESMSEATWIMGGRFLQWTHKGDFGGMPYDALSLEGYNNGDKRYESTWVDNFGTLILNFEGSCSDDGKKRAMSTKFADVVAGGMVDYRTEYEWVDDDTFTYTAYMDKGDGEFKNMKITYVRL
jgi:hypothetical protein